MPQETAIASNKMRLRETTLHKGPNIHVLMPTPRHRSSLLITLNQRSFATTPPTDQRTKAPLDFARISIRKRPNVHKQIRAAANLDSEQYEFHRSSCYDAQTSWLWFGIKITPLGITNEVRAGRGKGEEDGPCLIRAEATTAANVDRGACKLGLGVNRSSVYLFL